jgi:HEAT repeat protein
VIESLIGFVHYPDDWWVPELAAEALSGLGWKPETKDLRAAYFVATKDWEGCRQLGKLGTAKAIEYLAPLLYYRDSCHGFGYHHEIVEAFESFGEMAVEPLVKLLDESEIEVITEALGRISEPEVELIKALEDDDYRSVRGAAAEALGWIGNVSAVEPLIKALSDENTSVHKSAAGALDKLGWTPETDGQRAAYLIAVEDWKSMVEWGEPAVEPLIKALEKGNWGVCKSAAEALGEIGDARAVGALIKVLSHEDSDVGQNAIIALGDIGDERAVESLIKALGEGNSYAAWALGEIGDEHAVEPLIKALGEGRVRVRRNAAWALGEIGGAQAVEPLINALDDKEVCWRAKKALEKLGHEVE